MVDGMITKDRRTYSIRFLRQEKICPGHPGAMAVVEI
jgi:hypothetical protein